ncbi:MAG: HNH endonuclease [Planctomycetia bacterium]|nr:HNH endonuclease [Planctomycetia bacterium]
MTIRYELEPLHRNTPDAEFLDDLKRVADELRATTVTMVQYDERGRFSASALQRRFGSWHRALQRAGLAKVRNINTPQDELFNNLADVWTRLGRQPRMADLTSETSRLSADTYKRRFGGWRNALKAFVRWANCGNADGGQSNGPANGSALIRRRGPREPSLRLRFLVMRRDNFRCCYCGHSPATDPGVELNVDHIKAWAEGGFTVLDNLQTLCTKCNSGKSNLSARAGG